MFWALKHIVIDDESCGGPIDIINLDQEYISYLISEPDIGLFDLINVGEIFWRSQNWRGDNWESLSDLCIRLEDIKNSIY